MKKEPVLMIANPQTLATLQAEWQGVVSMRERIQHLVIFTFAFDSVKSPAFGDLLYNLPLLLAFDVLKRALRHAKNEGLFTTSKHQLSDLLQSAKTSLEWIDWQFLWEGAKCKDIGTPCDKFFGDKQCLHYIAIIEAQLVAWGILSVPEPVFPPSFPKFTSNMIHKTRQAYKELMSTLEQDTLDQYSDGRHLLSALHIERAQLLAELERLARAPQAMGTTVSIARFDLVRAQELLYELSILSEKIDSLILQINHYAERCGKPRVSIMDAMSS